MAWNAPYTYSAWQADKSGTPNSQLINGYLSNGSASLSTLPPATAGGPSADLGVREHYRYPLCELQGLRLLQLSLKLWTEPEWFRCRRRDPPQPGPNTSNFYYSTVGKNLVAGFHMQTGYTGPWVDGSTNGYVPYNLADYAEFDNLSGGSLQVSQFINDTSDDDSGIAAVQIVDNVPGFAPSRWPMRST